MARSHQISDATMISGAAIPRPKEIPLFLKRDGLRIGA